MGENKEGSNKKYKTLILLESQFKPKAGEKSQTTLRRLLTSQKSTMQVDISEFNKLVERNPASVAQFLRSTSNLKKVMIGDYLGQHKEFSLAVMYAYVDSMKFPEMKFHSAIREFLKDFRLS